MTTDVAGVSVGHWTDPVGGTGCTVVILPPGTVASGAVRGGAPGTREWALLDPAAHVDRIDAVVLSGGSAFGLAAADGVVRWCEEHGRGWPTPGGPVPIVIGLILYDLGVGDPSARPGADQGYGACTRASTGPVLTGRVGAGTGATVNKWRGLEGARPSGVGVATERAGDLVVSVLVSVNAMGELRPADGTPVALTPWPERPRLGRSGEHTTIGVVVTNAALTKGECRWVASSAHDGLARAIEPVHLTPDGDAFVAAATGELDAGGPVDQVLALAARASERAVRAAAAPTSGSG